LDDFDFILDVEETSCADYSTFNSIKFAPKFIPFPLELRQNKMIYK